jgi:hypothetical protein
MKKYAVIFLVVYFIAILMFAMLSTLDGFHDMIDNLRHNPADTYVSYTPNLTR